MKKRLTNILLIIAAVGICTSILSAAPSTRDAKKRIKRYWKTSYSKEKILKIRKSGKPYKKRARDKNFNTIEKLSIPFKVRVKRISDTRIYSIHVWYARKGVYGRSWKFVNIGVGDSKIVPGKAQKEPSKSKLKKLFSNFILKKHELHKYPYNLTKPVRVIRLRLSKGVLRSKGAKFWYEYNANFTLIDAKKKKKSCSRNYSNFTITKVNTGAAWKANVDYPQSCR